MVSSVAYFPLKGSLKIRTELSFKTFTEETGPFYFILHICFFRQTIKISLEICIALSLLCYLVHIYAQGTVGEMQKSTELTFLLRIIPAYDLEGH